jgi:transposase InsO family protein
MHTDKQVRLLRRKLMEGKTQQAAAAAADMSERSARTWTEGELPSAKRKPRSWRTRLDPFAEVWSTVVVPLLERDEDGVLEATTVLEVLHEKRPGQFHEGQVRTLQRRMRDWRALYGPEKEVFFEQVHAPGAEGSFDFTHATELGVTVGGQLLVHLLFEYVLSHSSWTFADVAFGETYEAMVAGLQDAFWESGGVPGCVRSDNLSAATHELKRAGGRQLNQRFRAFLDHYGVRSSRISPGKSNENGVAEQRHSRTKSAMAQALLLRGSKEFASVAAYRAFVREVVGKSHNRKVSEAFANESSALQPLPAARVPSYTIFRPKVRRWSTIRVAGRTYSVPSRLMGHEVEARQHPDFIEVLYRDKVVERMPRLRGESEARIDYRHVIWSLVRKPGAFANYRYREELFPTLVFRRTYDALRRFHGERVDVEYVRILHLAASTMEASVEASLSELLESGARFDYDAVKALAGPEKATVPEVTIPAVDLAWYDGLLAGGVR